MAGAQLKLITLLILCDLLLVETVDESQDRTPSPEYTYTENIQSKLYSWTLTNNNAPFTHCLVWISGGSDSGATNTICNKRYTVSQIEDIVHTWSSERERIDTLDLTCSVKHGYGTNGHWTNGNQCVCTQQDVDNATSSSELLQMAGNLNDTVFAYKTITNDSIKHSELGIRFAACHYPNILSPVAFMGLDNIRVLKIRDLSIERFHPGTFSDLTDLQYMQIANVTLNHNGLPDALLCTLPNLSIIAFENISETLFDFPTNIFSCRGNQAGNTSEKLQDLQKVTAVFAHGNRFRVLPRMAVGSIGSSLSVLSLSDNEINELHPMAFGGLVNLTELGLAKNKLESLPMDIFLPLRNLQHLDLSFNRFTQLNTSLFQPLTGLTELVLSHNQLFQIEGTFGLLPKLGILHLDNNRIDRLNETLFNNAYSLLKLYLHGNGITHFEQDSFGSLLFLRQLELKNNSISNSTNLKAAFQGKLERLAYLGLSHNNLTIIYNQMFQRRTYINSIEILDLSYNQISDIEPDAFLDMYRVYLMNINQNRLQVIEPGTFDRLPKLAILWIDFNDLRFLPTDFLPYPIIWLSLMNNQLATLPNVTKPYRKLQQIYVSYNDIFSLMREDLINFTSLTLLNATNCALRTLGEEVFLDLPQIEAVDLSNNKLNLNFTVDYWGRHTYLNYLNLSHNLIQSAEDLFRRNVKFVLFLDLSYNPLDIFPNQPKEEPFLESTISTTVGTNNLYLRNCSLRYIHPHAFDNMPNLNVLELSHNLLTEFKAFNVKTQDDEPYSVYLYGNPIKCSCKMQWLQDSELYKLSQCILVVSGETATFSDVKKDQFLCREEVNCLVDPGHCDCYTSDESSRVVTYLDCANNSLSTIPENIPISTKYLHLEHNKFLGFSLENIPNRIETIEINLQGSQIPNLEDADFRKLPNLEVLNLSENNLTTLTGNQLQGLHRLKQLYLDNNNLFNIDPAFFGNIIGVTHLSLHQNNMRNLEANTLEALSSMVYLEKLTLYGNPWQCPCDNATFKEWLLSHSDYISEISNITCNETAIVSIPDEDLLCYDNRVYIKTTSLNTFAVVLSSSLASVFALLTMTLVLIYYNRGLLEVLLFHRFGWRFRKQKEADNFLYDACAVYTNRSSDMPHWVRTVLMTNLEPRFKLYIPDRDSIPGRVQTEEIMTTIQQSKRSVFCLSQDAMGDDLFLYTFQTAYNYVLQAGVHHKIILLIMHGVDVNDALVGDLDKQLKAYLQAKQYISVKDKRFWKKVLFQMPNPGNDDKNTGSVSRNNGLVMQNSLVCFDNMAVHSNDNMKPKNW